ncbi:hypothetical protein EG329_008101 [Mollisiaceae sp. DMI_Dod_QoI]|nr:hypothetical protein EG329_008101 [Helotiales sp. DMI_Dod_QoI]
MFIDWQGYYFDAEAIRSHPYHALLQSNYTLNVIASFEVQESTFLEALLIWIVTIIGIWAKAILLTGIIWFCYRHFIAATRKEVQDNLEAGDDTSDEHKNENDEIEEDFVEAWTLSDSSTLM